MFESDRLVLAVLLSSERLVETTEAGASERTDPLAYLAFVEEGTPSAVTPTLDSSILRISTICAREEERRTPSEGEKKRRARSARRDRERSSRDFGRRVI